MQLRTFLRLIGGGEKSTVDFKMRCNAFNSRAGDQAKAKAELVKDICAMANNGAETSFLVIGVGDDRQTVESVTDANLNSANVQTLVRDHLHPLPFVRVTTQSWAGAPSPFNGAKFVIVQIGPNARHAFQLSRNLIGQGFHFRKNEVWVRNDDTSDLATPEQIVRLMGVRRSSQAEPTPDYVVTEYQKLPKGQAVPAMSRDAHEFFRERGIQVGPVQEPESGWLGGGSQFRIRVIIRRKAFVFRCVFAHELSSAVHLYFFDARWSGEHGLLVFVNGRYSKGGKLSGLRVDYKTGWGDFALLDVGARSRFNPFLPSGFAADRVGLLTAPNLSDTKRLRERTAEILKCLETDDQLFTYLDMERVRLTKELVKWSAKPVSEIKAAFAGTRNEAAPKEFVRNAKAVLKLAKGQRLAKSGPQLSLSSPVKRETIRFDSHRCTSMHLVAHKASIVSSKTTRDS